MEWYQVSAFTGSLELLITTHVHLVSFPDHHHVFWVLNAFCFSVMIQFCILNSDPNWWNPESKLSSACANSVYQALFLPLLRTWGRGYSLECWYHVLRPFKATNLGTRLAFCLSHRFAWVIVLPESSFGICTTFRIDMVTWPPHNFGHIVEQTLSLLCGQL